MVTAVSSSGAALSFVATGPSSETVMVKFVVLLFAGCRLSVAVAVIEMANGSSGLDESAWVSACSWLKV